MAGVNEFKTISKETTGDVVVKENTQFNNIVANNAIIEKYVTARFYGSVRGLLTLKQGSKLYLHGTLYGSVQNEGGEVHIFNKDQQ